MHVRFTTDARADLNEIFEYVAADSLPGAEALALRLQAACVQLGDAPRRYPIVFMRNGSEIRRRPVGSYNIYFRVEDSGVEIVRVVHGARDAARLLAET